MNNAQRKAMIGIIIVMIISFLFPPHATGSARDMGFSFIGNIPYDRSVYVTMLLIEWLGIGVIGGITYFLLREP